MGKKVYWIFEGDDAERSHAALRAGEFVAAMGASVAAFDEDAFLGLADCPGPRSCFVARIAHVLKIFGEMCTMVIDCRLDDEEKAAVSDVLDDVVFLSIHEIADNAVSSAKAVGR